MFSEVHIRILQKKDVTQNYVDWFKNEEIVEFSDNQYRKFTLSRQKEYVNSMLLNNDSDLYGIFDSSKHIGNIVLSNYANFHRRADITYVIGEKEYWGKGIASKAISLIIDKARDEYNLKKLTAGVAEKNEASKRVLEKNGFKLEGKKENHLIYNGVWMKQYDYGLLL